ncbi:hypothetical protein GGH96_000469 [Coemansia sp. RSA 1972]|nr:hypothetical protein GGH96_000469 [Coemansia sp. RSA 1972]
MQTNVCSSTQEIRQLILYHRPAYIKASQLELWPYASLVDTAGYVATTMLTDYSNNVMLQFGDTWQGAVNTLLKCKQRRAELVKELEAEEKSPADIRRKAELQIWWEIVKLLWPVLHSYHVGYRFAKQSLYYDVKVYLLQHLKAFVCLNVILAQEKMQFVQALPLRRS